MKRPHETRARPRTGCSCGNTTETRACSTPPLSSFLTNPQIQRERVKCFRRFTFDYVVAQDFGARIVLDIRIVGSTRALLCLPQGFPAKVPVSSVRARSKGVVIDSYREVRIVLANSDVRLTNALFAPVDGKESTDYQTLIQPLLRRPEPAAQGTPYKIYHVILQNDGCGTCKGRNRALFLRLTALRRMRRISRRDSFCKRGDGIPLA